MSPEYEKRKSYYQKRYLDNREKLLAQATAYQKLNPHVVAKAAKKYAVTHASAISSKRSAKYAKDPTRDLANNARWRANHKEERAAYMAHWREAQVIHRAAYDKAYRETHREERTATQNKRRLRGLSNGGSHTLAQWNLLKVAYGGACAYCGAVGALLTRDHDVPVSRGGSDDIGNIVPACFPCNRSKHAKTGKEYLEQLFIGKSK